MAAKSRSHLPFQLASRMLPTDAFFWYAEAATPQLRPLVAGIFMLDRAPERKRFRAAMERLVANVPRLHHHVVETALPIGFPEWANDPGFDLDYHLRTIMLPPPATDRVLFDFAGAVFATPLDHFRPLWEAYLIEGLTHGRAAFFIKMHHSVMDGAGAVALFDAMTQAHRDDPIRVPRRSASPLPPRPRPQLARQIGAMVRSAAALIGQATGAVADALGDPLPAIDAIARTAGRVGTMIRDLGEPPTADPLALRCTGIGRRLAGTSFSLPRLRCLKDPLGGTLNDLVLTIVSGALGRYHREQGIHLEEVACVVPMSLRQDHESHTLGNRVGAFNVMLPVQLRNPRARLRRIQEQTKISKGLGKGANYQALMQAIALVPAAGFRFLAQQASGRIHLICSNVPGPQVQRYLAGAKVDVVHAFAPVMLGTPLSIALVSYGDSVGVGIDADPAAIPDPERIREHLEHELDIIERQVFRRSRSAVPANAPARRAMAKSDRHERHGQSRAVVADEATVRTPSAPLAEPIAALVAQESM